MALRGLSRWSALALGLAALTALPALVVVSHVGADSEGLWAHMASTVLGGYVRNTLGLVLGVGAGALLLGVPTAWVVTTCAFPLRRVLLVALLLPLSVPTYLMAYAYTDLLQLGPIPIRSLGGAIFTFSFVLYPYVFLLARAAFLEQSACALDVSRTLGAGPWRSFFTVALPMARPAIVAGLALVLMETLAEYGAVDYFAVDTFTTGIYRAWSALGSPAAACQLAAALLAFVLVVLAGERIARGRARYAAPTGRARTAHRRRLAGARAALAVALCLAPVCLGFVVPAATLATNALAADPATRWLDVPQLAGNTAFVAAAAAALVALVGLLVAYGRRLDPRLAVRVGARVSASGYALPGSVVAVGVLVAVGHFDRWTGLWASGTIAALLYAYAVRFQALSLHALEAGLAKVRPSMDDAARTLGSGPGGVLARVHAPLVSGSLLTALLLVFVEVMKELPATMIVRPFDFETLAVHVHRYASDERLAEAAAPALMIVAVGLVPVALLSRAIERVGERRAAA